ncbi:DUF4192 domain-containing protein [Streptomyces sp. 16-176A]|uniref:DUF4192 domain-containing protein n=1 Tax=Streptomyces sp. 16-176A TaxID=2530458 RepID=UPI00345DC250
MTNHSETAGPSENGDITYDGPGPEHQVTLRTPAELADALPYLLGYPPEDSIVLAALHDQGGRGRFGGRARLGIPPNPADWPSAARQLAQGLITGSERRGAKPEQMVAFVCQEPSPGETGREVMLRLRPLAQKLRTECGRLDVPVIEALCISAGRFWSYCCPSTGCCPDEGLPMGLPGTSVLAAAATYAGIQVRGSLRELRARLLPRETGADRGQESALDAANRALVPRILDEDKRAEVAAQTLDLAERVMRRFAQASFLADASAADLRDDALLRDEEAASLILGLQDRTTRDRAAEWMEGDEAGPALRLWRALARRCVGPYGEHAAAPLTLAGWVAWSTGDGIEAREALAMALGADPDYLFARLLHQACNEGLDPESVRRCLRTEREARIRPADDDIDTGGPGEGPATEDDGGVGGAPCGGGAVGVRGGGGADGGVPQDAPSAGDDGGSGVRSTTAHRDRGVTRAVPDATPARRRRPRPDGSGTAAHPAPEGTRPTAPGGGRTRTGPSPAPSRTRPHAAGKGAATRRRDARQPGAGLRRHTPEGRG